MSVQLRPVTSRGRGVTAKHDWLQPSRSGFDSWRPCHADEALTVERLVAGEEAAGSIPAIRSRSRSSAAERLRDVQEGERSSPSVIIGRELWSPTGWKLSPAEQAALNRKAPGSIPGHPIRPVRPMAGHLVVCEETTVRVPSRGARSRAAISGPRAPQTAASIRGSSARQSGWLLTSVGAGSSPALGARERGRRPPAGLIRRSRLVRLQGSPLAMAPSANGRPPGPQPGNRSSTLRGAVADDSLVGIPDPRPRTREP
jgi:hypothetical protein